MYLVNIEQSKTRKESERWGNEKIYISAFLGAIIFQWLITFFIFKIGALGYESVLDCVLFLSFTASGDAILFINPPIFSLIYILVETTRRKILNIMNIFFNDTLYWSHLFHLLACFHARSFYSKWFEDLDGAEASVIKSRNSLIYK